MAALNFDMGDIGGGTPPFSVKETLYILEDFLQPNSTLSLEGAIDSMVPFLPNSNQRADRYGFALLCLEFAEQIPYTHIYSPPEVSSTFRVSWKESEGTCNRYQELGEAIRDRFSWPDKDNPSEYVNYQAFVANIEACHIFRSDPTYAIWTMRDAFEETHKAGIIRDAYILGAAQHILWSGQYVFQQLLFPGDISDSDRRKWSPGPLYRGDGVEPLLTLHRWHFWANSFKAVAMEKNSSDECKAVAKKAASLMNFIERDMTFDNLTNEPRKGRFYRLFQWLR
ncbi:hypothetical protein FQN57_000849 [Myotisia sp. PD_48]|nr:hypothetical protein FQN57_000849 [Myotisia sp. PD_48]